MRVLRKKAKKNCVAAAFALIFMALSAGAQASDDSANMLKNPGAEETRTVREYKDDAGLKSLKGQPLPNLPAGWGIFMGGAPVKVEWGASEEGARQGKNYFLLRIKENIDSVKSRVAILVGDCSGVDGGARAIPNTVKNAGMYYSVWLSGKTDSFETRLIVWDGKGDTGKHIKLQSGGNLSKIWQKVSGTFSVPDGAQSFALAIVPLAPKEGDFIAADDAVIKELPVPRELKCDLSKAPLVGVYNNGAFNTAQPPVRAVPGVGTEFKAEWFSSLKKEDLFKYDVVILSGIAGLSPSDKGKPDADIKETDHIGNLLAFADSGRGIVLGYNCIGSDGFWCNPRLFPEMIRSTQDNGAGEALKINVAEKTHPIVKTLPPELTLNGRVSFSFGAGKMADVLYVDSQNKALVAAGKYPRGRVVMTGFALNELNDVNGADAAVAELIRNAVVWAGGGLRYDTAPEVTETGLAAAVKRESAGDKPEDLQKYLALPPPRFDEKVMFCHIFRLITPEQLRSMVRNVKDMGFDGIIVNSVLKKLTYPSQYYDKSAMITDFDQLEVVVDEAKKQGLKYGFTFGLFQPLAGSAEPTEFPKNLTEEDHKAGKKLRPEASYWACPDHPGVRERGLKAVKEQIERYHPDYMYLDFIRYIDDYASSCFCEYSLARKKEFAAANPHLKPEEINTAFSELSLTSYVRQFQDLCKKSDPKITTILYTMTPNESDSKWLFKYPVDWHTKYVSRSMTGMWRDIEAVAKMTILYDGLNRKLNPVENSEFLPMIAGRHGFPNEPCKSPERLEAEIKLLSATLDKVPVRRRLMIFYEYMHFVDPRTYAPDAKYTAMFKRMFQPSQAK
jgi:hypothetical protein